MEPTLALKAMTLEQPVVVVADLDVATDRMHALFGALPSERLPGDYNAVYPFGNNTYFEVLGTVEPGHTRERFVRRFGPGFYMICSTLAHQDVDAVEAELRRRGKRIVRSMTHRNVRKTWHIHPQDGAGLLVLLAVKTDWQDNGDWCGHHYRNYVKGNTRFVDEVGGVLARCADPAAQAGGFRELGFDLQPAASAGGHGGQCWRGDGGTVLELWPADAWPGRAVDALRDYAVLLRSRNAPALLARMARCGLGGEANVAGGRWVSGVDPVLGVRFAVESL